MFKILMAVSLALVSCGKGSSGNGGPDAATAPDAPYSMAVTDDNGLPACNDKNLGQLVYVKSSSQFKVCEAGNWANIDIKGEAGAAGKDGKNGTNGQDGATIAGVYNLKSAISDVATRWDNVAAWLNGGNLVEYADGTVVINASLFVFESYDITGSGVDADQYDTDKFEFNVGGTIPAELDTVSFLFTKQARTGSDTDRQLWLLYERESGDVSIWYDTDDDGELETTDELIETLTKEEV